MKNSKPYIIAGTILAVTGAAFIILALTHPEWSFPWPNSFTYSVFALYGVFTLLVFLMPKTKNPGLCTCICLALQFVALALIFRSVSLRSEEVSRNWYLPCGLFLTAVTNFIYAGLSKKKKRTFASSEEKTEETKDR